MIIAVDEVMELPEFVGQNEKVIAAKLNAVELAIRSYTNNNFQNRYVRFHAESLENRLLGTSDFLRVGDTVQISQSQVNDGLYVITEIGNDFIRFAGAVAERVRITSSDRRIANAYRHVAVFLCDDALVGGKYLSVLARYRGRFAIPLVC